MLGLRPPQPPRKPSFNVVKKVWLICLFLIILTGIAVLPGLPSLASGYHYPIPTPTGSVWCSSPDSSDPFSYAWSVVSGSHTGSNQLTSIDSESRWRFNPGFQFSLNPGMAYSWAQSLYLAGSGYNSNKTGKAELYLSGTLVAFDPLSARNGSVHSAGDLDSQNNQTWSISGWPVGDTFEIWATFTTVSGANAIQEIFSNVGICFTPYGSSPTPSTLTPMPTATLTLPAGPSVYDGIFGSCLIPGNASSVFQDLPGNWTLSNDAQTNPPGESVGLLLPFGLVSQELYLDPSATYSVSLRFHTISPQAGQHFFFGLGAGAFINVPIDNTGDSQAYDSTFVHWQPDRAGVNRFLFEVGSDVQSPDPGLIIDFACVKQSDGSSAPPITDTSSSEGCTSCTYAPKGGFVNIADDLLGLLRWLWCGLRALIFCVLIPAVKGIWAGIIQLLTFLALLRLWFELIIERAIVWGVTNLQILWAWLSGALQNIVQTALNTAAIVFNKLNLVGIINAVLAFVRGILIWVVQTIPVIIQIVSTVWSVILFWLTAIVVAIAQILVAIPIAISALVAGFNTGAIATPIYAPACTTPGVFLYYPCLGGYVLDNTVWDGPMYLLMIVILGMLAFNTILWGLRAIQEAMSK